MSYEIQEGYPKLRNVAKKDNALAIQYKSKFDEVNADIAGAQALIDDDPTSENYNGDLVLNADKLNAICDSLDDLQPPFINAKGTLAEWMTNFSKEVTEYDSTETYNYGEVVTYQDTSETIQSNAYTIDVPSGAKLATVQKYGGKSLAFNQFVNGMDTDTKDGITTEYVDGEIVITNNSRTSNYTTGSTRYDVSPDRLVVGHKVFVHLSRSVAGISIFVGGNPSQEIPSGTIATVKNANYPLLRITSAYDFVTTHPIGDVTRVKLCIFDLTQMFGAGNEPTTVDEVKALLPNDYYEYNTGEVIHADVDKVVEQGVNLYNPTYIEDYIPCDLPSGTSVTAMIKDFISTEHSVMINYYDANKTRIDFWTLQANNSGQKTFTLNGNAKFFNFDGSGSDVSSYGSRLYFGTSTTYHPYRRNEYPIPQAIKFLEGYGWSAGSVYNEVDFERKKFIKRVGRVDMGSLSWSYSTSGNTYFSTRINDKSTVNIHNLLCGIYEEVAKTGSNLGNMEMAPNGGTDRTAIYFRNDAYTDAPTFKSAMNGVYLYYELAEPVETDITDILEPFNVEDGGTITFHNSNGDGYRLPVPSKIKFGHGINGTFICIDKNVTGAFNTSKWLMLTPSDLGFDLTDAEVIDNNGLVEIYLNDEMIAQVTPNLLYLDDEDDAQNGMVYLVQVDGDKYQLRYKDDSGNVNIINNETNASISTYENNSIQTELNKLKEFMEGSD